MRRARALVGPLLFLLVLSSQPAAADVTLSGVVQGPSAPVAVEVVRYPIALGPGDVVTAALVYTPTPGADLDLAMYSPFYDAIPLADVVEGGDPAVLQSAAQHYVAQRAGRAACADTVASSEVHGGSDHGRERILARLDAGAEAGVYALNVQAFASAADVPFTLTLTVTDASGVDVTADRLGLPEHASVVNPTFYCDAGARAFLAP